VLQVGRSWIRFLMRILHFFNLFIPSSRIMALGSTAPKRNEYQEISGGLMAAGAQGWQINRHLRSNCLENVGASTSYNSMDLHGLLQGQLYIYLKHWQAGNLDSKCLIRSLSWGTEILCVMLPNNKNTEHYSDNFSGLKLKNSQQQNPLTLSLSPLYVSLNDVAFVVCCMFESQCRSNNFLSVWQSCSSSGSKIRIHVFRKLSQYYWILSSHSWDCEQYLLECVSV
jgi:hypothetical protein